MCYDPALDPSKLESRAVRPSRFAGTSLRIFRGVLFRLRFDGLICLVREICTFLISLAAVFVGAVFTALRTKSCLSMERFLSLWSAEVCSA